MTAHTIAPPRAVSNHVQRRGLLAGVGLLAAGATIGSGPEFPTPAAISPIIAMAMRVKSIMDREIELDEKGFGNLTPAEKAEEGLLYEERTELSVQIIASRPADLTEALVVILHGVDRASYANHFDGLGDLIEQAERAIGSSLRFLAGELNISLTPFGSEQFLPERLYPLVGRA